MLAMSKFASVVHAQFPRNFSFPVHSPAEHLKGRWNVLFESISRARARGRHGLRHGCAHGSHAPTPAKRAWLPRTLWARPPFDWHTPSGASRDGADGLLARVPFRGLY